MQDEDPPGFPTVPLTVVTFQQKASSETYGHGASLIENKWSMVPENNVELGGGGIFFSLQG